MTAIKERPILFSAPMVRAILEGRKTVTRRPVKATKAHADGFIMFDHGNGWRPYNMFGDSEVDSEGMEYPIPCPYGQPGDRLWVRETWYCDHFEVQQGPYLKPVDMHDLDQSREDGELVYAADGLTPYEQEQPTWKPSIHMPRWASRILLEITDVRVERLQDISREGCIAEGPDLPVADHLDRAWHVQFQRLWESTGGDWDTNPWVWVVEFKQVTP